MNMGVQVLFVMIVGLEELFFGCRFSLESPDKLILLWLDGNYLGLLDEYSSISQMIEFLNKWVDGSVSIIYIGHVRV